MDDGVQKDGDADVIDFTAKTAKQKPQEMRLFQSQHVVRAAMITDRLGGSLKLENGEVVLNPEGLSSFCSEGDYFVTDSHGGNARTIPGQQFEEGYYPMDGISDNPNQEPEGNTMSVLDFRLSCLDMAVRMSMPGSTTEDVIKNARMMFEFITDEDP